MNHALHILDAPVSDHSLPKLLGQVYWPRVFCYCLRHLPPEAAVMHRRVNFIGVRSLSKADERWLQEREREEESRVMESERQ